MDKIEVETSLIYTAPKPTSGDGLLFRIKDGKLTSENPTKGVILYNPKNGRIETAEISIKLKGDLTVTIGGTDTKVELDQEQKTTIKTSDDVFRQEVTPSNGPVTLATRAAWPPVFSFDVSAGCRMRFAVLGAAGQLGRDLCPRLPGEVVPLSRADIDLDAPNRSLAQSSVTEPDVLVTAPRTTSWTRPRPSRSRVRGERLGRAGARASLPRRG